MQLCSSDNHYTTGPNEQSKTEKKESMTYDENVLECNNNITVKVTSPTRSRNCY